ncbi:MAG: hypothetical protein WD069_04805 [Planctomycetales bacterium]
MNDAVPPLGKELRDLAQEAGSPKALTRWRLVRIRANQTMLVLGTAGMFVLVFMAGLWGLRIATNERPTVPGSGADNVLYVLNDAPPEEHFPAAIESLQTSEAGFSSLHRAMVGNDGDFVPSPDGASLYVVSRLPTGDGGFRDTASVFSLPGMEKAGEIGTPGWQGTTGIRVIRKLAVDPTGSHLFVLTGFVDGPADSQQAILTLDLGRGKALAEVAPLSGCGSGPMMFPTAEFSLVVICREVDQARFLDLNATGALEETTTLPIRRSGETSTDEFGNVTDVSYAAAAVHDAASDRIFVVFRDGRISVIDAGTRAIAETVQLKLPDGFSVGVPHAGLREGELVLGLGRRGNLDATKGDGVVTVDTESWSVSDLITTASFSSLDVSQSSPEVYTLDRDSGGLQHIDVASSEVSELGTIQGRPQGLIIGP